MPVLWVVILLAVLVAVVGGFVGVGHQGVTLEGIGILFVVPLGVVAMVAVNGFRGRWDRWLAGVGVFASAMTFAIAVSLYAAISVGQGLGALFTAVAGGSAEVAQFSLLGVTAVASVVAGVGCLLAVAIGPPRRFVVDDDPVAIGPVDAQSGS